MIVWEITIGAILVLFSDCNRAKLDLGGFFFDQIAILGTSGVEASGVD